MSEAKLRRILIPATAGILLAYYLFFVMPGLGRYFDDDDTMNLYLAWSRPLLQSYRPLGALFYRGIFALAGFNPLPFRMVCIALGVLNMGLCWWFARLVTASDRAAALCVLLFAFQSRLMEVWFRTAVIYDLLCFTFFYLAVCIFMSRRKAGLLVIACFLLALAAKENAVALPVVLAVCGFAERRYWIPLVCGLIDLPYMWFKTHGPMAMTAIADYQPQYSYARFSEDWARYMNYLFLQESTVTPWIAMAILATLLIAALRSRPLVIAWVVLFATTLPVAFLPYRGGFVLYTSYAGWTLYVAIVLAALQDLVRVHKTALACLVFVLVGWRWGKANLHDQRADPRHWLWRSPAQVRQLADALPALAPQLRAGARCLFVEDAFSADEWTPYFVMKLFYRDDTLVPDRVKRMDVKPKDWSDYQWVFTYADGRYQRLKP